MKKFSLCFGLAFFIFSGSIFARDYCIGFTLGGFGPTAVRGSGYDSFMEDNYCKGFVGMPFSLNFSPMIDISGQVDLFKHLGLEFGVGYSQRSIGFLVEKDADGNTLDGNFINKYTFSRLAIPLLFKLQIPVNSHINFYLGTGLRTNFNLMMKTILYEEKKKDSADNFRNDFSPVDLDIAILTGVEYYINKKHVVGLRIGYDFNMIGSFRDADNDTRKVYLDALGISLTYRYVIADSRPLQADMSYMFKR